jgi:hypothetical protein
MDGSNKASMRSILYEYSKTFRIRETDLGQRPYRANIAYEHLHHG